MLRWTRLCGLGLALAVALTAPVEAAGPAGTDSPKAPAVAAATPGLRLVRALSLHSMVDAMLGAVVPPGDPMVIASRMFDQDKGTLSAFESEVAGLYERRFTPEELRRLAEFLESDLGKKWVAQQPDIVREQMAALDQGKTSLGVMREIGCATSLLAPALAKAKAKAGLSEPGIPADFQARFDALATASRGFCGCIFREAEKKGKGAALRDPAQLESLAQEAVTSGACPLPSLDGK